MLAESILALARRPKRPSDFGQFTIRAQAFDVDADLAIRCRGHERDLLRV